MVAVRILNLVVPLAMPSWIATAMRIRDTPATCGRSRAVTPLIGLAIGRAT